MPHTLPRSLNSHLRIVGVLPVLISWYLRGYSWDAARVPAGYTHVKGEDLRTVAEAIDQIYN